MGIGSTVRGWFKPSPKPTPAPTPAPSPSGSSSSSVTIGSGGAKSIGTPAQVAGFTSQGGTSTTTTSRGGGGGSSSATTLGGSGAMSIGTPTQVAGFTSQGVTNKGVTTLKPGESSIGLANQGNIQGGALLTTKQALGTFFTTMGSNIKTVATGGMDVNKPGWNLKNPFVGFEYASATKASEVVQNPFFRPTKSTINPYDVTQKSTITYGELEKSGFPTNVNTGARQFSSTQALKTAGTIGVIGASVLNPTIAVVASEYQFTKAAGRVSNPNIGFGEKAFNVGIAGLSLVGVKYATAGYSTKFSREYMNLEYESLSTKAGKSLFLGEETRMGKNIAIQTYGKIVEQPGASLQIGATSTIYGTEKGAMSLTKSFQRFETKDWYTGKPFSSLTNQEITSFGKPGMRTFGTTPSFGQSFSFTPAQVTKIGQNIRLDILPKGYYKEYFSGGRVKQMGSFKFSQSQKVQGTYVKQVGGITPSGEEFGVTRFGFTIPKSGSGAILKIRSPTSREFVGKFESFYTTGKSQSFTIGKTENIKYGGNIQQSLIQKNTPSSFSKVGSMTVTEPQITSMKISTTRAQPLYTSQLLASKEMVSQRKVKEVSFSSSKLFVQQPTITSNLFNIKQTQTFAPITTTTTITTPFTQQKQTGLGIGFGSFTPSTLKFGFPGFVPPFMPFSMPAMDFGSIGGKIKGKKRRSKYTPSFGALVFGIRGKAPKGTETGARIRPITKGFKWEFGRAKL